MTIEILTRRNDEHPIDWAARLAGGRIALAQVLGVTVTALGNWKARGIPFEKCMPIEHATDGVVTRKDLRPQDWQDHWPELAQVTANIAQAATENVAGQGA